MVAMGALIYSLPEEPSLSRLIDNAYRYAQNDETYKPESFRQDLEAYLTLKQGNVTVIVLGASCVLAGERFGVLRLVEAKLLPNS